MVSVERLPDRLSGSSVVIHLGGSLSDHLRAVGAEVLVEL
jgi:hypothetical protein